MFGTYWKMIESHWSMGRYSYSSASSYEYTRVYSSKKNAINRMKENINNWIEWQDKKHSCVKILMDTNERMTAMCYNSTLDQWRLIDVIIEETTVS